MADIKKIRDDAFKALDLTQENSGVYNGKWVEYNKENALNSISPIDGTSLGSISTASTNDYDKSVKIIEKAFLEWSETPAPTRGNIIRKISRSLEEQKANLGKIVSLEAGKVITEGEGEIQEMIDVGYFASGLSRQLYGSMMVSERPMHRLYDQYVPLGPIGIISAFNFPTAVWSWNSLIAAVTGDTSIWKPSSKGSLAAVAVMKVIAKVIEEESAPPIFALVNGRGSKIGELMISDKRLKLISFTGSVKTGKRISTVVSGRLGRTLLELGGNNCAIVSEKADMNMALKGVAFGALATTGQRCTSTRRIVVNSKIYDEFLSKLISIYKTTKIGNPLDKGILVGPLIDNNAISNYEQAIQTAIKQGGKILYGGKVLSRENGYYVQPTLIEAREDMAITREETFAPILYVFTYNTMPEAMKIHNDVPQGLASSIFTNDLKEEEYFLSVRGSDCGIANINTSTAGAEIGGAFGGEKDTGGGRESGSDAWKLYMRRQTVTKNYGNDVPLSQGVTFDID